MGKDADNKATPVRIGEFGLITEPRKTNEIEKIVDNVTIEADSSIDLGDGFSHPAIERKGANQIFIAVASSVQPWRVLSHANPFMDSVLTTGFFFPSSEFNDTFDASSPCLLIPIMKVTNLDTPQDFQSALLISNNITDKFSRVRIQNQNTENSGQFTVWVIRRY